MKILRLGCNDRLYGDCNVLREKGYPHYLLLLVKTPALFIFNDKPIRTDANTAVIYSPNTPHIYSKSGDEYINDWVHFSDSNGIVESMGVLTNTPIKLKDPSGIYELSHIMVSEFYNAGASSNSVISHCMSALLFKIKDQSLIDASLGTHYCLLVRLREQIYESPEKNWSVKAMSEKINLSEGYLQLLYKKAFGVSCINDVIKARIQKAKYLLTDTCMTSKQIAFSCGYNTHEHFTRQFTSFTGKSPLAWRKDTSNTNIDAFF